MRKLLVILALISAGFAQEIRRPTVDATTASSSVCSGTNLSSAAMTSSYDAGIPPTTTFSTLGSASVGTARWRGRVFTGWAAASGSYSTLSLNINFDCQGAPAGWGQCAADYSLNGGSTWTNLFNYSDGNPQQTATLSIPAGTTLTSVQVRLCSKANYDSTDVQDSSTNFDVWDIWTSGTLSSGGRRRVVISN